MLFTKWNMDDALKVEREEGYEEGYKKGLEEARKELCAEFHKALASLMERLKEAGRYDEFIEAIEDPKKTDALFREFNIPNPYDLTESDRTKE